MTDQFGPDIPQDYCNDNNDLRDKFAIMALNSWLNKYDPEIFDETEAILIYQIADLMLEARNK
jgi:hypothetical protein